MIIILFVETLPRAAGAALTRAAAVMPVVVVTGARQTGKTTLVLDRARMRDAAYFSLDDLDVRSQARDNPTDLLRRGTRVVLDEVQREPALLSAVKRLVDRERTPGRFIVTGSANLLLMRRVSETLAGRAAYLTLYPMTRRELSGQGRTGLWTELMHTPHTQWRDLVSDTPSTPEDWTTAVLRGGYPPPAIEMHDADARRIWFSGYTQTYLERDVQDVSSVTNLPDLRRLMRATCLRIGQLVNQAELGRDIALPQPTVHRWLNLLETSYQVVRLQAYAVNRTKRLIKTPKLYWSDPGLALHLAGLSSPTGAYLENLVLADILAWRGICTESTEVLYWRTAIGEEVDFVIETDGRLLPIEVKATTTPTVRDARHLQTFRREYPRISHVGLLLHAGTSTEWLAPDVLATPWWRVV